MPHRSEAELRDKVQGALLTGRDFSMLFIARDVGPLLDRLADARRMLRAREWTEGEVFEFCQECGGLHPESWDRYAAEVKKAEDPAWECDRNWIEHTVKPRLERMSRGHAADCALVKMLAAGPDERIPEPKAQGPV